MFDWRSRPLALLTIKSKQSSYIFATMMGKCNSLSPASTEPVNNQTCEKSVADHHKSIDLDIEQALAENRHDISPEFFCNSLAGSSPHLNLKSTGSTIILCHTSDDVILSIFPLLCYTLLVSLGGIVYGYDIGTVGGIVDIPAFVRKFGDHSTANGDKVFKPITKGCLVSIACLGGFVSGFVSNQTIPLIGMRFTLSLAMLVYMLGIILALIAPTYHVVIVSRLLNGLAVGISTVACPMYISEITPVKYRGVLTCFNQLFTTIGIVIGSVTMYFSATRFNSDNNAQFLYPLCQGGFLSLLAAASIWLVPESPQWLARKENNVEKVKKALSRLNYLNINDEKVIDNTVKLYDIQAVNRSNIEMNGKRARSIIRGEPKYLFRTIIGILIYGFQQFTGINFFFFYGLTIFKGIQVKSPYQIPVMLGVINLFFSSLSVYTISKFPRRHLLLFGSISLSSLMVCFTIAGAILKNKFDVTVPLILISCAFIAVFSITWGPIASVVISEMYPSTIKVKAMSICGSCAWIFNFMISLIIPTLTKYIGLGVGGGFAFATVCGGVFVYFFVPETRNTTTTVLDFHYQEKGRLYRRLCR